MRLMSSVCPICQQRKGSPFNHSKCSKLLQQRAQAEAVGKKKKTHSKFNEQSINFLLSQVRHYESQP